MGQFDFPSSAALSQLKNEAISTSPIDRTASRIAGVGAKILELAGFIGVGNLTDLILELKNLAANKDEANLIYFGETLVEDIRRLYKLNAEMRQRVEEQLKSNEFHEAVANATLHITRTNVGARLKRIATLIANGVRSRDLEQESLDDMMRAAAELTDADVALLRKIYESQNSMLGWKNMNPQNWHGSIQQIWRTFVDSGKLNPQEHLSYRSSFGRLESRGLIQRIENTGMHGVGQDLYALLMEGKKFYERLEEIAS